MLKTFRKKSSAFTLLEIIVVIIIIGILVTFGFASYKNVIRRSIWAEAYANCNDLAKAIYAYHLEHGSWPGRGAGVVGQSMPADLAIEVPQSKYWTYQAHKHTDSGDAQANLIDADKWSIKDGGYEYTGLQIQVFPNGSRIYSYCVGNICSHRASSSGWTF